MTLLAAQGFDDSIPEVGVTLTSASTNVAGGRSGVGGVLAMSTTSSSAICTFTPSSTVIAGVGVKHANGYGSTSSFLRLDEGTTTHLSLRFDAAGHMELYRGEGTTLLATSTWLAPPLNTWFFVEIKATIADAGGSVEVRVGETVIMSFSGDTRNAGTAGTPDRLRLAIGTSGSASVSFDDLYILNGVDATATQGAPFNNYLGDVVVRMPLPDGNGDSSQWVGSDGNSVDNRLLVDEPNSSMTDYVGSATSGNTDLYAMADIPTNYDVLAIQEVIYAQASDAGTPPTVLPVAKGALGAVRTDTALPTLSTTPLSYPAQLRFTDPDGNALTPARVNAMQVGVRIA